MGTGMGMDTGTTGGISLSPLVFERRAFGRLSAILVVAVALCCFGETASARWTLDRGVTLRATYTDNVNFAGDSDVVFDITPRFALRRDEAVSRGRVDLDVRYGLSALPGQSLVFSNFRHNGQADLSVELVKRRFFFEGRATAAQQTINNRGGTSDEIFNFSGNFTQSYTYQFGPVYRHHFGPYADGVARFAVNGVINEDVANTDSTGDLFEVALSSGRKFARTPWRISHLRESIDNEGSGQDVEFSRSDAQLSYIIDRRFSVTGSVGWDEDDFQGAESDDDGFRWQVSTTYRPSTRTSFTLGYGDQFAGPSIFFDLTYRGRRTILTAGVSERRSTVRDLQIQQVVIPINNSFGNPIIDPFSGQPFGIAVDLASVRDDVVNLREYEARAAHEFRGLNTDVRIFRTERDFEILNDDEIVTGVNGSIGRSLNSRASVSLFGGWQETEFEVDNRTDERWNIGLSYRHQVSAKVAAVADVQHIERDSTDASARTGAENRASLRLNVNF